MSDFLETRATLAIYENGLLWHSESLYGTQGPECLVLIDAQAVYEWCKDQPNLVFRCEVRFDDTVQHWTRTNDAYWTKQSEATRPY